MPKKSKRRKRRKLSTSSSEEDGEISTTKTKTTKRKYDLSPRREKNDGSVQKTRDRRSSSKHEAQSSRQIKKPVSRLEKTKSPRGESPIFKYEESKNRKKPESKSSKESSGKTSSQDKLKAEKDILIPRSVSVAHKVESKSESTRKRRWDVQSPSVQTSEANKSYLVSHESTRKKRWDVQSASVKTTEAIKSHLLSKDETTPKKNEPTKQENGQGDFKTELKSKTLAVSTSKETTTATKTDLKTTTKTLPSQQLTTLKERTIAPPQPPSKKTVAAEKSAEHQKTSQSPSGTTKSLAQNVQKQDSKPSFRNSFSPVCQADSTTSKTFSVLSNFKLPAVTVEKKTAIDKNKTLPVKSDHKAFPARHPDPTSCKTPAVTTAKETTIATTSKTTVKVSPAQQRKTLKESNTVTHLPPGRLTFKIPKKTVVAETSVKHNANVPTKIVQTPSTHELAPSVSKQVPHSSSSVTVSSNQNVPKPDPWPSLVNSFAPNADPSPWQDQTQVAEELHQARSEKLLKVDVMQSYGELTCMEIDPPEEGEIDTEYKGQPEQDLIIVLDTNILLSHLDYVKKIVSRGLQALSHPVVLIPWVVLQELDSLKKGRGLSGSVAHLAIPAISYIYTSLKGKESRLWGQSMQQAAESANGLSAENNDDRVLQCCLQFQLLYKECAVILCTNDKNLCSKALLSGVKAFTKNDLETAVARYSLGSSFLQNVQTSSTAAQARCSVSTLTPGNVHTQAQEGHSQEAARVSVEKENNQQSKASDEARRRSWHLERLVCEFESCLQEALSDVLEAEMKAAYDDLWLEIVYRKPPWSLHDVLHCLKKHWIAVFGQVVPRAKQQNVMNLIEFFTSGKAVDRNSTLKALLEAEDLLKEFVNRSTRVSGAISVVNNILNNLQTQGETSADDVVMKEAEEDKQPTLFQVSHSQVWALFENIWEHVFQASLSVFKALDFDPNACVSALPAGGPPPPQDVLLCLDKLMCTVSQLLQAFSSVLTSPGLVEAQGLLNLMQSIQIVGVDKLTAADLLNCFAQQEYREKLNVGGNQLLEVKTALDRCVEVTGRHLSFTAQP